MLFWAFLCVVLSYTSACHDSDWGTSTCQLWNNMNCYAVAYGTDFCKWLWNFFVTELLNFSLNFHLTWRCWLNWDKKCRSCVLHCSPTPFLLWEKECMIPWAAIGWLFLKHTHWIGKEMPASRVCSAFLLKSEFILSETDHLYQCLFIFYFINCVKLMHYDDIVSVKRHIYFISETTLDLD